MPLQQNTFYKFSFSFFLLICSALFHVSCSSGSSSVVNSKDSSVAYSLPEPVQLPGAEIERLRQHCQAWYDSVLKVKGFNGGMLVAKDGNIVFEQYHGTAHLPGNDTITVHSPMHIASVSKNFTAMAVLKLQQEGKLNINDEFSKYFPAFNYPGVTILSLLSHRSGLPNYNYFMEKLGWDKSRYVSNQDVLDYLINRKAEFTDVQTPNTHFNYCNTNYALLALLIEKVSGTPYPEHIKKTFFIPLQMKDSYVFTLADTNRAIPSYNWRSGLEPYTFLDQVYGDKNIYTTVRDLLTWDRALSSNLIFTKETLDQAYAPYSNEKPGIRNYGLGWRMFNFPDGRRIIYHNGWWHGSNSTFIRLLDEKGTIIIIGNKFTRAVYNARVLSSAFGDHYDTEEEEEPGLARDNISTNDSILAKKVTTTLRPKKTKKRKGRVKK